MFVSSVEGIRVAAENYAKQKLVSMLEVWERDAGAVQLKTKSGKKVLNRQERANRAQREAKEALAAGLFVGCDC